MDIPQSQDLVEKIRELPARMSEYARAIADGLKNEEIAERLGVTSFTVQGTISGLYKRLGLGRSVGNKTSRELVKEAWRLAINTPTAPAEGASSPEEPPVDSDLEDGSTEPPAPVLNGHDRGHAVTKPEGLAKVESDGVVVQALRDEISQLREMLAGLTKTSEPTAAMPVQVPTSGVGLTTVLPDPASIRGVYILRMDEPDFEKEWKRLFNEGFVPELMNEFQSLSHPDMLCVRSFVFVKRTEKQ